MGTKISRGNSVALDALSYARKKIRFLNDSPIQGKFEESRYPFLKDPIVALDDIHAKCTVIYKPAQAMGTVYMQIATAYRLDIKRKSIMAVAQTDADAKDFSQVKLGPFLLSIASLRDTVRRGPYSISQTKWLWPMHELLINGPGENATESKSVPYVHTDEAHLWCVNYPGALEALENRMGNRWNRAGLHVTTAAESGTDIDLRYYQGGQNEWHLGCPHCTKLIWPLWINDARNPYNGEEVFHWKDSQSESETFDSIRMVCPHCSKEIIEHPVTRTEMDGLGAYVAMNPEADRAFNSFRWNYFAAKWMSWRDCLAAYNGAIYKAKLGNLKSYIDFVKKKEVRSNNGDFPMMDRSTVYISDNWAARNDTIRLGATDYQAGKEGEAPHWWAGVAEYARNGDSRRIAYQKLHSWVEVRAFQQDNGVKDPNATNSKPQFASDCGYRDKEVFARCAQWRWYALRGDDAVEFDHISQPDPKRPPIRTTAPYSHPWLGNSTVGRALPTVGNGRIIGVPPNMCLGMYWSNPTIYAIFHALRTGQSGREYGIPPNFSKEFIEQHAAFLPVVELDKARNLPKRTVFKCVKPGNDHAWDIENMCLVLAILHGYFPLDYAAKESEAA